MAYQSGKNVKVAYKVEGDFGTAPGASDAIQFRASPGTGLSLAKAQIQPTEFRSDGQTVQSRHGSRSVSGQYEADLSVGTFDALLEAVFRGTWLPSFTITNSAMTSITTPTANTIVAAGGSWITQGLRVGDVVRLTGHSSTDNNGRNLRVIGLTASTITVGETLVIDTTPDNSFTLTVSKRLIMGNPMVKRSFTFEECYQDIGGSELFKGCRITSLTLRLQPDQPVLLTFGLIGQNMETLSGGSSPYFTNPTVSVAQPLVCVDGKLNVNGTDVVDFTNCEITFDLNGATQPVLSSVISPEVFTNDANVTVSLSAMRDDLSYLDLFLNETQFGIHALCVEPGTEPKPFTSFYLGNCKAMGNEANIGDDNAMIETMQVNVGKDMRGGAYSPTMIQVSTSAS